jgi:hypothetical protein
MKSKRVYRVTWQSRGSTVPEVRHFFTRSAAKHRVEVLCQGWPEEPDTHIDYASGEGDGRPEIPPAAWVRVDVSDPLLFPADYADQVAALMRSLAPKRAS